MLFPNLNPNLISTQMSYVSHRTSCVVRRASSFFPRALRAVHAPAIVPWFDRAGEAYGRVTHLASAHPELARDPYLRHLEAAASRQLRTPQTAARV